MLKDPEKFRIGFHMAGAGALASNRMGSEALVSAQDCSRLAGLQLLLSYGPDQKLVFQLLGCEALPFD